MSVRLLWSRWAGYWFRPVPLLTLDVCRILIVANQIWELLGRQHFIISRTRLPEVLYDPLPVVRLLTLPWGWSGWGSLAGGPWAYRPSFAAVDWIYALTVAVGVTSLIGLCTRTSLAAFALGNLFLQALAYSFGDHHHPEALTMIALGLLALSPAGRTLSVDAWRQHRTWLAARSPMAAWPLLTVQWLFAIVYLSAACSKLAVAGWDWMNGYTLQYHLAVDAARNGVALGAWLSQHHTLVQGMSWMAIVFEATFFLVLIVPRLRWIYLPLGAAFHIGIYFAMHAPFFQWVVLYAAFIPWASVAGFRRRVS